jgi:6-pyruvoyl tetrahydropterin synthase/QueD family protein
MHGHTWDIEISVTGPVNPKTGMVIDFSALKDFLVEPIKESLDHKILNDQKLPTAENIACILMDWCTQRLHSNLKKLGITSKTKVTSVRVWESPDSYATVRQELKVGGI